MRASAAWWTASGTPALSRPSSSVSSGRKAKSGVAVDPRVVSRTRREPRRIRVPRQTRQSSRAWQSRRGPDSRGPARRKARSVISNPGRADDIDGHAQAGRHAQHGSRVLRDIGCEKRKAHGRRLAPVPGKPASGQAAACAKLTAQRAANRLVKAKEECKKNARQYVLLGARGPITDNSRTLKNRPSKRAGYSSDGVRKRRCSMWPAGAESSAAGLSDGQGVQREAQLASHSAE